MNKGTITIELEDFEMTCPAGKTCTYTMVLGSSIRHLIFEFHLFEDVWRSRICRR